ncbi:DUF819 family protein [Kordiimonas aestuarii]|uniref:DUF819 family protein n=1 Tax=Kordiimonas aestuarii TaxID=1005925 RepID=UPI0021D34AF8|nr:DUF819 family protein [Kordiimonas aestuarii]
MITDGFSYLAILLLVGGAIRMLETSTKHRLFDYLPGVVALYFIVMLMATFGVWEQTDSVNATYSSVKGNLLPAMIFLMLLKGDLRKIIGLGPRMLLAFAVSATSIGIGFVVTYAAFKAWLPADAWKAFAALSGSWMGGTGNMAAIQGALSVPDTAMGYTLLMDSVDYALWVILLLALVPYAAAFNRWTRSDTAAIDRIGARLEAAEGADETPIDFTALVFLIGVALAASALSQTFAGLMPATSFFTGTTWAVLIATILGVVAAMTPMGRIAGSNEVANVMLYAIIGLIASRADFAGLAEAPLYVAAGLMVLAVHGLAMVGAAKLFRLDLFSCGIASLANIGGVASAPILAAAYSQLLIPIGVLMAMLGYIIGTGGGLLVGKILSLL